MKWLDFEQAFCVRSCMTGKIYGIFLVFSYALDFANKLEQSKKSVEIVVVPFNGDMV